MSTIEANEVRASVSGSTAASHASCSAGLIRLGRFREASLSSSASSSLRSSLFVQLRIAFSSFGVRGGLPKPMPTFPNAPSSSSCSIRWPLASLARWYASSRVAWSYCAGVSVSPASSRECSSCRSFFCQSDGSRCRRICS